MSSFFPISYLSLTLITFWANSADDKLVVFFLFFSENRLRHFMKIVSYEKICMKL